MRYLNVEYKVRDLSVSFGGMVRCAILAGEFSLQGVICAIMNFLKKIEISKMKKLLLTAAVTLLAAEISFAQGTHWSWDVHQFASTMTCTAVAEINGVEQMSGQLEVGAFCGDECRGAVIAIPVEMPSIGVSMYPFFISICGNGGDAIHFRIYDHAKGEELDVDCENMLTFAAEASYGTLPFDPYVLRFKGLYVTITATAAPADGGAVTGGGPAWYGADATVTATANDGYVFSNWTEDGATVSNDASYTFNATADRTLTANFTKFDNAEEHLSDNATAYPNPTDGKLHVAADNMQRLTFINIKGQIVSDTDCNADQLTIDTSPLTPGLYILKIRTRNGVTVKNIIKK